MLLSLALFGLVLKHQRAGGLRNIPIQMVDDDDSDEHTYATVCFRSPQDKDAARFVELDALVDTGSTDCELRESFVRLLGLPLEGEESFETATGTEVERTYRVLVECCGQRCEALVTSTPDWRFGRDVAEEDEATDEAVLGHQALAELGLLVDCRGRVLVPRSHVEG